jgi:hypothetical protein
VTVCTAAEIRDAEVETKQASRAASRLERGQVDDAAVLSAIDQLTRTGEPTFRRVQAAAQLSQARFDQALERLEGSGLIARCQVEFTAGKGARRTGPGLRRIGPENG